MATQELEFKVVGPAMRVPYPLHDVLNIQREFLSIFDASYAVLAGKPRLSREDRLRYRILAAYPREGSYIQPIGIDITDPTTLLVAGAVVASQVSPKELWENAKAAYDFLKLIFRARQEGQTPSVTENVNGDKIVAMPGSSVEVNRFTFITANRAESHFRHLAERIESGAIDQISTTDSSGGGIQVSQREKQLFLAGSSTVGREFELSGRVFDFNTELRGGKVRILSGERLPPHDYIFEVQGEQSILPYIIALTRDSVRLRCIPEYLIRTTGTQLVRKLWILEILGVQPSDIGPLFHADSK